MRGNTISLYVNYGSENVITVAKSTATAENVIGFEKGFTQGGSNFATTGKHLIVAGGEMSTTGGNVTRIDRNTTLPLFIFCIKEHR